MTILVDIDTYSGWFDNITKEMREGNISVVRVKARDQCAMS